MEYYNDMYKEYYTEEDLDALKPVLSSHIADALKHIGYKNCVVPSEIRPVVPGGKVIGSAVTLYAGKARSGMENRGLKQMIDDISKPGDVIVMDCAGDMNYVMLGGRVAYRAKKKGVQAVFIDGTTRDVAEITEHGLPVFARGTALMASEGEFENFGYNMPVRLAGITVKPGDIIVADDTGAVVIPKEVAKKVIHYAVDRQEIDDESYKAIFDGRPYVHQHFHDDDMEKLHSQE